MRIALLVDPLTLREKGGDHAPQLARELLGRGHEVRGFGAPPGVIPHSAEESADGLGTPSLEATGRGVQAFQPGVLVAYDALSPTAWLGARVARKLGVPLVLVEAGIAPSSRLHQRVLQCIGERLWGRYVRQTARSVVALDPVAKGLALEEGFDEAQIRVVPQGVDLERFRPGLMSSLVSRHRITGRILLYCGRLEASRGLETLMHAFARTVGQRDDWSLVLAGEGSMRGELRAMADRLGTAARVHLLGRPRVEEQPGLIGACTMLAVPALDDEVRGKMIGRAMAAGKPVLASTLPRLDFLVRNGETGLCSTPGDVDAWTENLQRACSSPQARERWGAEARRQAEKRLSWSTLAQEFEGVIAEALDPATAPEPEGRGLGSRRASA